MAAPEFAHAQRTTGNREVQGELQAHDERREAGWAGAASCHSERDFSRIPIHPPGAGANGTKAVVSRRIDAYEQEADGISQQMVRRSEPPRQPLQTKRVQASDPGQLPAPSVVHEVLRASGQSLDPATRGFMESRFDHDFSQVRVHADAKAAESAQAVSALAYTAGRHVVFGAGQYAPGTNEGRRLLAHELTHVVQQATASSRLRSADSVSSSVGSEGLQRKPDERRQEEKRREQRLEELARDPGRAHQAWKKLSTGEKFAVLERMRRRYGGPFAQQFIETANKGKPQIETSYHPHGSGPTPEQLIAGGYRLAWASWELPGNPAFAVDIWVHPSGREIQRGVSTYKFGEGKPEKKPETEAKKPGTEAKKPPIVKPPNTEPPPLSDKQIEALDALEKLQNSNDSLSNLCKADPFPLDDAVDAQIEWTFAREKLRSELKNVDMSSVYPDFWKEVTDETNENTGLRVECCKRNPSEYYFFCDELKTRNP